MQGWLAQDVQTALSVRTAHDPPWVATKLSMVFVPSCWDREYLISKSSQGMLLDFRQKRLHSPQGQAMVLRSSDSEGLVCEPTGFPRLSAAVPAGIAGAAAAVVRTAFPFVRRLEPRRRKEFEMKLHEDQGVNPSPCRMFRTVNCSDTKHDKIRGIALSLSKQPPLPPAPLLRTRKIQAPGCHLSVGVYGDAYIQCRSDAKPTIAHGTDTSPIFFLIFILDLTGSGRP